MNRRRILAALTAAGAATLAGCSGGGGGDGDETEATTTATRSETVTATSEPTGTSATTATRTATPTGTGTATGTPTPTETTARTGTRTPTETSDGSVTVRVADFSFEPVRATVSAGTTVTWVNDDGVSHDVTATAYDDAAADWEFAERLSGGASTEYTFEDPGVYQYLCTIHGRRSMCGAVLVGDVSLPSSMPCE